MLVCFVGSFVLKQKKGERDGADADRLFEKSAVIHC